MKHFSICLSLISLFISACAGTATATSTPQLTSASDPLTTAPNPLTVQAHTDNSRMNSGIIPISGGTLSATAADGTKFTLTLPKDALLQETEISLLPVTQIDGLPLDGGLLSAVQIEPGGLDLLVPATLTIELSSPIPTDDLLTVSFAYEGNGAEFHLTPSSVEGQTITYSLYHFSGHGSGRGTKANVKKQKKDHPPTKPQDRLDQLNSEILAQAIEEERAIDDEYQNIVEPQINAAVEAEKKGGDAADTSLKEAIQSFEKWLKKVTEAGLKQKFAKEIDVSYKLLVQGIKYALDDAHKRCLEGDDIEQSLRIEEWLVAWKFFPPQYTGEKSAYEKKLEECRYHFSLDIKFIWDNGGPGGSTYSVSQVKVPIALQRGGIFSGEGAGTQSTRATDTASGCIKEWEQGATWRASGALDTGAHVLETNLVEVLAPYEEPAFCGINGRGTVPGTTINIFMDELTVAFPIPSQAGQSLLVSPFYVGKGNVSLTLLANK